MRPFISCLLLIFVFAQLARAQKAVEPIATDRPDQTETPILTPKKFFQAEIGFAREKNGAATNWLLPTALLKYSLSDFFEARLILEGQTSRIKTGNRVERTGGLVPVEIGMKVKIAEEKGLIPHTSLIGHISLPNWASKDRKGVYSALNFRFTMQHTLSSFSTFSYNLGAEWDGRSPEPVFIYTLANGYTFSDKWGGYIELYGFAPQKQSAAHNFDAGITYLVFPNLQFDVSAGFGITKNAPDHFVGCGVSFRLPR